MQMWKPIEMAVGPLKNTGERRTERKFWAGKCEVLYFDGGNRTNSRI
jgi:hypothetical protein